MKRILISLFTIFLLATNITQAHETKQAVNKADLLKVNKVGYQILNANKIPYIMTFELADKKYANACTYYRNNLIMITDELIKYLESDDELAAILAHEISHGVDYRQGALRGYFSYLGNTFNPRKYEYKADKRAVDYLVKAGYNPLAMIISLNKIAAQERYEWTSTHPLTSRRMAEVYEYIYTKYPQYLVQNIYKDNIYYQNFLLTSKDNRKKLEVKVNNNSKKKVNYL